MYVKTERLELKAIREESLDALVALATDEMVREFYMFPDFPDRAAAEAMARRLMKLSEGNDRIMVGIYLGEQFTGILNQVEVVDGTIELGYALLPRFQKRGICTEALTGAIGWCLENGFREVICGAFDGNAASFRVMQKSGMTLLDRTDEIDYRGKRHLCRYYGTQNRKTFL